MIHGHYVKCHIPSIKCQREPDPTLDLNRHINTPRTGEESLRLRKNYKTDSNPQALKEFKNMVITQLIFSLTISTSLIARFTMWLPLTYSTKPQRILSSNLWQMVTGYSKAWDKWGHSECRIGCLISICSHIYRTVMVQKWDFEDASMDLHWVQRYDEGIYGDFTWNWRRCPGINDQIILRYTSIIPLY